jgi:hypothetical protein
MYVGTMEGNGKMDDEGELEFEEYFLKKYRELFDHHELSSNGGIFKKKRRKQLLGILRKSGRDRPLEESHNPLEGKTKASFWYDVRETVRNGLIDLQLFIETADDKNVNMVLNRESLAPVVYALLDHSKLYHRSEDDGTKAKIAQMLAEYGLSYLRDSKFVYEAQRRTIDEAIQLSKQITISLLPEKERESFFHGEENGQ